MSCTHECDDATYLPCLDLPGHEVYICKCGALINISDPRNLGGENQHVMSGKDIEAMMREARQIVLQQVADYVERKIRKG